MGIFDRNSSTGALVSPLLPTSGGGITWSDPVDANIVPDANSTRNLGSGANRFATGYFHLLDLGGADPYLYLEDTGGNYIQMYAGSTPFTDGGNTPVINVVEGSGGGMAIVNYNGGVLDIFSRNDGAGSGNVIVGSGNSGGSNSGNTIIRTGTSSATRGDIALDARKISCFSGALELNDSYSSSWWGGNTRGIFSDLLVSSGSALSFATKDTSQVTDASGYIAILSGANSATTTGSGEGSGGIYIASGGVLGTRNSGEFYVETGATGSGLSGSITLQTGNSASGNSGNFTFQTGTASGGTRGSMSFTAGSFSFGGGGQMLLSSLASLRLPFYAGDVPGATAGDIWYDTTNQQLKAYVNGSIVVLA